jgi:hypothetical protein
MPKLHHGAERHMFEVRDVWVNQWVFVIENAAGNYASRLFAREQGTQLHV